MSDLCISREASRLEGEALEYGMSIFAARETDWFSLAQDICGNRHAEWEDEVESKY